MKFQLLIKTEIPTNKEVSCFKSLRCYIYHANILTDFKNATLNSFFHLVNNSNVNYLKIFFFHLSVYKHHGRRFIRPFTVQ